MGLLFLAAGVVMVAGSCEASRLLLLLLLSMLFCPLLGFVMGSGLPIFFSEVHMVEISVRYVSKTMWLGMERSKTDDVREVH